MSEREHDVIIYMRHVQLEVVIPKKYIWKFMDEFGEQFAIEDSHSGKCIKPVDNYFDHPNGWHITVSIWENYEEKFYNFLEKFCKQRKLSFRDPRKEE